jgi:hypothetical protein
VQVDRIDVLALKQICRFAKDHVLENGPIVSISERALISVIWIVILHAYLGSSKAAFEVFMFTLVKLIVSDDRLIQSIDM